MKNMYLQLTEEGSLAEYSEKDKTELEAFKSTSVLKLLYFSVML